ncbi:MAG: hypothetical protein QOH56_4084, partial [Pseudonocardiales bacterium]|nr:hypothetical protein [Pseudonocardiales bacterium]
GTSDQHGTAVAEIVHQMAPRAQIILYCVDNNIGFAQAEQQAVADGVSIVNSSLGFDADGRGDGTGINLPGTYVSTALTVKSARQAGILWIQSAGNSAQDHWSGKLVDADTSGPGKNYIDLLNKTRDYDQIQVPPGQGVSISLSWDQWPSSTVPVNLEVIEINVSTGRCTHTAANGSCTSVYAGQAIPGVPHAPVRYINVFNESTTDYYNYQISIKRSGAVPAIRYDLSYAGAASPSLLAAPTFWSAPASHGNPARAAAGSVSEPASSPYALAAGAFDLNSADTTTTRPYYNKLEPFSSRGPTIDGRVKPDLIGYDGVSSNLSEFSTTRFYGTSAGAPHIAGAAALVLGANPALDPAQIQAELEQRATNNTSPPTNANGHGLINLGSPTDTPAPSTGSKYVPLDHPVRVMDTRDATFGHHAKLRAAEQIAVNPALAGVPDDATAVVVNLTGEGATGSLYLAAYPSTFSGTSNLNLSAKTSTAAISAVVPLDPTSHQFKVLNSSATVDVIVDVAGYFTESAAATGKVGYAPLATPQRILDTRPTSQTGSHSGQLSPNESITVSVPASSGVPSGATGIIANITATGGSGAGALATNPPPPGIRLTSNLNYTRADRANLAVIAVQPDGSFTLLNLGSKVQVVIDVLGYFAPSASGTFVPLRSPVRIADSRSGNGGYLGFVQPAKDLSIDAAKLYDVPYNALGVWTNVLAISAKGGLLTAYPTGPSVPNISTLNFTPNEPTPNGSVLAASTVSGEEGMVSVHASTTTYVVLDLFGYFQP